jgi:hypothetical protein
MIANRKEKDAAARDDNQPNGPKLVGFRNCYVFDVSQTDGADLPAFAHVTGDVGEYRDRLFTFVAEQGIALSFSEDIAPAMGMSYGGRITLLPGQPKAEEFSTLVHECAHELLHRTERGASTSKVIRETEAEAVAFIVSKAAGLDTGTASVDYIRLYDGNAAILTESLQFIQQAASAILAALEPSPGGVPTMQLAEAC